MMSRVATARVYAQDTPFAREVRTGLAQEQKSIPCTWLYDRRGSELFEEITQLPEYYPTRSELSLLRDHLSQFGRDFGKHASVLEIGAGASRKTRLLLAALRAPYAYLSVDISEEFLYEALQELQSEFPEVRCTPLVLDFTEPRALSKIGQRLPAEGPRLGFFPGSTIGNLEPEEAGRLLGQLGSVLGEEGALLLGVDSTCDPKVLLPAYDDARGVTAAFNLNLLVRVNRELEGDFRLENFRHEARFDEQHSRVEMHLVSLLPQRVSVLGRTYLFEAGESIHTENSHKFSRAQFLQIAATAGWSEGAIWTHPDSGFEVHVLRRLRAHPPLPIKRK
jgi:dimethylhistidine N-methyltransferase